MSIESPSFLLFVLVSLLVLVGILRFVMRRRVPLPPWWAIGLTAVIVTGVAIAVARLSGVPWWIYETVPVLVKYALPPVAFRFSFRELWQYLVLALLSSPLIYLAFAQFFR